MAKNWTLKEAYDALRENDKSAILDFGKRFPLATNAVSRIKDADVLLGALPSHMTMRKIEIALKNGVEPYEDEDDEVMTPEQAKAKKAKEEPKKEEKKAPAKKGRPKKVTEPDPVPEEEEEEKDNPYDGMSAPELFKLCKKRGIKAEPKQKAAAYIKLLEEADSKEEEEEAEDDSWDDEEEEAPEPKKEKKGKAAPKKEEEDDDDWDI